MRRSHKLTVDASIDATEHLLTQLRSGDIPEAEIAALMRCNAAMLAQQADIISGRPMNANLAAMWIDLINEYDTLAGSRTDD